MENNRPYSEKPNNIGLASTVICGKHSKIGCAIFVQQPAISILRRDTMGCLGHMSAGVLTMWGRPQRVVAALKVAKIRTKTILKVRGAH